MKSALTNQMQRMLTIIQINDTGSYLEPHPRTRVDWIRRMARRFIGDVGAALPGGGVVVVGGERAAALDAPLDLFGQDLIRSIGIGKERFPPLLGTSTVYSIEVRAGRS